MPRVDFYKFPQKKCLGPGLGPGHVADVEAAPRRHGVGPGQLLVKRLGNAGGLSLRRHARRGLRHLLRLPAAASAILPPALPASRSPPFFCVPLLKLN